MHVVTCLLVISLSLVFGSADEPPRGTSANVESNTEPTPVVLWHGFLDTCCSSHTMVRLIRLIKHEREGVYIRSLMMGSSLFWDRVHTVFMDANKQVDFACQLIADDPNLQRGYHGVGVSQGAQFLRAVAQRCPDPPMFILVSLGGQHQGIYGVEKFWYTKPLKFLGKHISYWNIVRKKIVVAQNWHDPIHHDQYVKRNTFIADINNERENHPEYRENLVKLKHLVLVKFEYDQAVVPSESSWFGFYKKGQAKKIETMFQTELFRKDRIGLKVLFDSKRLHLVSFHGIHLQFQDEWFINGITLPYLTKTYW